VGEEFVEDLLKIQKDDRYAFSILALLYPQLDYRNNDFHKDHLHPISAFTEVEADILGLAGDDRTVFLSWEWNNSIINLQMLDANENKSKQDASLVDWVALETKQRDRETFLRKCLIPTNQDLGLKNFPAFIQARKKLLVTKLTELLA
jgi:hypothetical protein